MFDEEDSHDQPVGFVGEIPPPPPPPPTSTMMPTHNSASFTASTETTGKEPGHQQHPSMSGFSGTFATGNDSSIREELNNRFKHFSSASSLDGIVMDEDIQGQQATMQFQDGEQSIISSPSTIAVMEQENDYEEKQRENEEENSPELNSAVSGDQESHQVVHESVWSGHASQPHEMHKKQSESLHDQSMHEQFEKMDIHASSPKLSLAGSNGSPKSFLPAESDSFHASPKLSMQAESISSFPEESMSFHSRSQSFSKKSSVTSTAASPTYAMQLLQDEDDESTDTNYENLKFVK